MNKEDKRFWGMVGMIIIGIIVAICLMVGLSPKVTKIEHPEDNSAIITDCIHHVKAENEVKILTKYGEDCISNDDYYNKYKDNIGTQVTVKLQKFYYENNTTSIDIYSIENN